MTTSLSLVHTSITSPCGIHLLETSPANHPSVPHVLSFTKRRNCLFPFITLSLALLSTQPGTRDPIKHVLVQRIRKQTNPTLQIVTLRLREKK